MAKKDYLGPAAKRSDQFTVSLSKADVRLVRKRIELLEMGGPSEFFRTLLHQAVGARLAVVTDFDVVPTGRVP